MRAYLTRCVGTLGIMAAAFLIRVPAVWAAEARVDWINRVNVSVLTWGELLPSGGTASPAAVTIDLDPRQRWRDTGVWVSTGDSLTINARGVAQLSPNPNDIAWPSGSRSGRRAPDAPLRDERAGTLIARIGDSAPILIGEHRSIVVATGGFLYLGVNDDYLADNAGEFQVQILVRPRY